MILNKALPAPIGGIASHAALLVDDCLFEYGPDGWRMYRGWHFDDGRRREGWRTDEAWHPWDMHSGSTNTSPGRIEQHLRDGGWDQGTWRVLGHNSWNFVWHIRNNWLSPT
jgi:hypothetical protein